MAKITKAPLAPVAGQIHKDRNLPKDLLRFSFRHFDFTEKFCAPADEAAGNYFSAFMDRFKAVSGMKVMEFRTDKSKALRAHKHDWTNTTEAAGYAHLNEQLRECEPWQFCISANEHGRIHGILIDSVFYVVWLDPHHRLYP